MLEAISQLDNYMAVGLEGLAGDYEDQAHQKALGPANKINEHG